MIGRNLGHYEVTGLLGKGGMGEVYRARDTRLDRDVALKILPAAMAADASRLERFHQEAKTVAGLNHPHIVHLYSVEEADGIRFLTMELVDGQELGAVLESGRLHLDRVLDIGISVAEALAEAHAKGVVHRDLKPANVMIGSDGRVKVLDFGLAKLARTEPDPDDDVTRALELTGEGSVLGTVPYMSPEQLRGQEVDARTDIFSLGILLYELASGRRPFDGSNTADITSAILKDEVPDLLEIDDSLPAPLGSVVRQCLEKDRGARPQSAREVAGSLRALRARLESGIFDAAPAQGRSRRGVAVAAVLSLVVIVAIAWWTRRPAPEAAHGDRPVVAVLPFENLGSEDEEYFAAGITDEITSRLALIDGLGVISRTSARVYAETDKSIPEVGRDLGAGYVLEGAILWDKSREPERVRITPRLIRVEDDTNLWSDNYLREVDEIFALQSAIAARIAEALDVTLLAPVRDALQERPTENMAAYKAYLQGLKQLDAPSFDRDSFELGVHMFERATALDPGFALAHARLSSMHSRMVHHGFDRTRKRRQVARESAERALALQPDLAEAHLALGHFYYWCERDYDAALAEFERAREIEPNNSDVWLATAYVKRRQGALEAAVDLLERDRELSPLDPNVAVGLGETYGTLRRYAEAEKSLRQAIELAPDDPYPYTELALLYLRWRGDATSAREVLESMPAVEMGESYRVRFLTELLGGDLDAAMGQLDACPESVFEAGAFYLPLDLLAGMVHQLRNEDAAAAAFRGARELLEAQLALSPDDPRLHSALGLAEAGLGNAGAAIEHGERAVALYPLTEDALGAPVQITHLALVHAMLGDAGSCAREIERVLTIPSTMSVAWLRADPRWRGVRETPEFQRLLNRFGPG